MDEVGRTLRRAVGLGAAAGLMAGAWAAAFDAFGGTGLRAGAALGIGVGGLTYAALAVGPGHRARRRLDDLTAADPARGRRLRDALLADRVHQLSEDERALAPAHARARRDERYHALATAPLALVPLGSLLLQAPSQGSAYLAVVLLMAATGLLLVGREAGRARRFSRWLDRNAHADADHDLA